MNFNQSATANRIAVYIDAHRSSLGLILAAYGAFYLAASIMSGWNPSSWGIDVFPNPLPQLTPLLPRSFVSIIFFVTSLPALLIGTAILCAYCIRSLRHGITINSEHIAILLASFGFAYLVVGAWPLQNVVDFPWDWQKQIMGYGVAFAWLLYIMAVVVAVLGFTSLYVHSKAYHKKQSELPSTC